MNQKPAKSEKAAIETEADKDLPGKTHATGVRENEGPVARAIKKLKKAQKDRPPSIEVVDGKRTFKGEDDLVSLTNAFGSGNQALANSQMNLLSSIVRDSVQNFNAALAFAHSLQAEDALEGALAAQMAGAHYLAMKCMGQASASDDQEYSNLKMNQATKLMRTFTLQMEALARNRGKAPQKIIVERVVVNSGGQAIVGAVEQRDKGGGMNKRDDEPHAKRSGWLKNGNRPGDFFKAPRCGARTRLAGSCQAPAMKNGRCRLHGGKSTGPKTAKGKERISKAQTIHGRYSKAERELRAHVEGILEDLKKYWR